MCFNGRNYFLLLQKISINLLLDLKSFIILLNLLQCKIFQETIYSQARHKLNSIAYYAEEAPIEIIPLKKQ